MSIVAIRKAFNIMYVTWNILHFPLDLRCVGLSLQNENNFEELNISSDIDILKPTSSTFEVQPIKTT